MSILHVNLSFLDLIIIVLFVVSVLFIAIYSSKSINNNAANYILAGRNMPWYLAGISMVATTFAADTPLAITNMVRTSGVSGNWLWWHLLIGGMFTTFFFSKLWHRAGVLTETELITFRYKGKAAEFLRKLKSIYLGLIINLIILAWVNIALVTILQHMVGLTPEQAFVAMVVCLILVAFYAMASGLKGVIYTDVLQFVLAMAGCIILAILVVRSPEVGGINSLKLKLGEKTLSFLPDLTDATKTMGWPQFLTFTLVAWWSSWYPGNEPGGGGYIAQRMMSCKNEKHAFYSNILFQVSNIALRPWPWIIVALATAVLYPQLSADNYRDGYVMAASQFLPSGLKGLLLVAFLGAYMSTISSQLNWGAGYIANDFFSNKDGKSFVKITRILTIIIALISIPVCTQMGSIPGAWQFLLTSSAGIGGVLILRWFWWRINAWSEITATIAPFLFYIIIWSLNKVEVTNIEEPYFLLINTLLTTLCWVTVTFFTKPEDDITLQQFTDRIKPFGAWKNYIKDNNTSILFVFVGWFSAVILTYCILFGIGYVIFKDYDSLLKVIMIFVPFGGLLWLSLKKMKMI